MVGSHIILVLLALEQLEGMLVALNSSAARDITCVDVVSYRCLPKYSIPRIIAFNTKSPSHTTPSTSCE